MKCSFIQKKETLSVVDITNESFAEVIKSKNIVVIYFYAHWCKFCTRFTPIVDEIASENLFVVGKIDVDLSPEIFQKYRDKYIPMLVIFKDGEMIGKIVGTTPKNEIMDSIKKFEEKK